MDEFGHVGFIGGGLCIDTWGAGPFVIGVDGRSYLFEDSDRFGPSLIKLNGDPKTYPFPPERHPFWRAHRIWKRQGRRTEDGINCLWDEPKPQKVRMVGRMAVVIDEGKPHLVIAFAGGFGTLDMVRRAKAHGVHVTKVTSP